MNRILLLLLLCSFFLCACQKAEPATSTEATTTEIITATVATAEIIETAVTATEIATAEIVTSEATTTEATTTEATTTEVTTAETTTATTEPTPVTVTVPILMFHHLAETEGGDWSMSVENFRARMEFLLEHGYTPIGFDTLIAFADGKGELPEKPVCITLDDGYYSNYVYALPIATELQIPITVCIIGSAVRSADTAADSATLDFMSAEELHEMESSPYVTLIPHTHALHITGYGGNGQRENIRPLASEDKAAYTAMLTADCEAVEAVLGDAGVQDFTVFSYPGGKSHKWAEAVLQARGYRVTLTTDPVRANRITQGKPQTLYGLGRLNVNDQTTDKELLRYLRKK